MPLNKKTFHDHAGAEMFSYIVIVLTNVFIQDHCMISMFLVGVFEEIPDSYSG